jgi:hypothetical protein
MDVTSAAIGSVNTTIEIVMHMPGRNALNLPATLQALDL